jgi:hypothetical protein
MKIVSATSVGADLRLQPAAEMMTTRIHRLTWQSFYRIGGARKTPQALYCR